MAVEEQLDQHLQGRRFCCRGRRRRLNRLVELAECGHLLRIQQAVLAQVFQRKVGALSSGPC